MPGTSGRVSLTVAGIGGEVLHLGGVQLVIFRGALLDGRRRGRDIHLRPLHLRSQDQVDFGALAGGDLDGLSGGIETFLGRQ